MGTKRVINSTSEQWVEVCKKSIGCQTQSYENGECQRSDSSAKIENFTKITNLLKEYDQEKTDLESEAESFRNKVMAQAESNNFSEEQKIVLQKRLDMYADRMDKELKQQKTNEDEQEK